MHTDITRLIAAVDIFIYKQERYWNCMPNSNIIEITDFDAPQLMQEEKLAIVLGTEREGLAPDTIARCDLRCGYRWRMALIL